MKPASDGCGFWLAALHPYNRVLYKRLITLTLTLLVTDKVNIVLNSMTQTISLAKQPSKVHVSNERLINGQSQPRSLDQFQQPRIYDNKSNGHNLNCHHHNHNHHHHWVTLLFGLVFC